MDEGSIWSQTGVRVKEVRESLHSREGRPEHVEVAHPAVGPGDRLPPVRMRGLRPEAPALTAPLATVVTGPRRR